MTAEYTSNFKGKKITVLLKNGDTHTGYLKDVTEITNPNNRVIPVCVLSSENKEDTIFPVASVKAIASDRE